MNDLAQIDQVFSNDRCVVRLKPRIQLNLKREFSRAGCTCCEAFDESVQTHDNRPDSCWFSKGCLLDQGLEVRTRREIYNKSMVLFYSFRGELYKDGFLYHMFHSDWLLVGELVTPRAQEVEDWNLAPAMSGEQPNEKILSTYPVNR